MRDQVYRIYLDFLETAEKKRRWNIFDSIPWEQLDASKSTIATKQGIEVYCSEELYVPDYGSKGIALLRSVFGMAWFQTRWTFEESQHGLVFREYLIRSGSLTEDQFADLEAGVTSKAWSLPFETARQMVCYGALQEGVTYIAYRNQRDKAVLAGDKVLEAIFFNVARDEAAHGGFYRAIVSQELSSDRAGTIADLAFVLTNFKMPGDGLIPGYRVRLEAYGAGIPPRMFIERVVLPLITSLKVAHGELRLAMKRFRSAARLQKRPRGGSVTRQNGRYREILRDATDRRPNASHDGSGSGQIPPRQTDYDSLADSQAGAACIQGRERLARSSRSGRQMDCDSAGTR